MAQCECEYRKKIQRCVVTTIVWLFVTVNMIDLYATYRWVPVASEQFLPARWLMQWWGKDVFTIVFVGLLVLFRLFFWCIWRRLDGYTIAVLTLDDTRYVLSARLLLLVACAVWTVGDFYWGVLNFNMQYTAMAHDLWEVLSPCS